MKLERKQIIFIILLVSIPLCAYFWIFLPAQKNFSTKRHEIEEKQQKLQKLQTSMGEFANLDSEIQQLGQVLQAFDEKLPTQHEIHQVLRKITELTEQRGLETTTFESQKAVPFARYAEMPIKISMTGDYNAFYQFLLDLEQTPRITRITQLDIKNIDNSGYIKAAFELSVFFEAASQ